MNEYEKICKHVGKIVLDFHFNEEKIVEKFQSALEDFKKRLAEKDALIKKLQDELEVLRSK